MDTVQREPTVHLGGVSGVTATDEGSVEALYEASYHRLVGVLALACASRTEAEEVVQEAFLRVLPRAGHVMSLDDPEAWVRIAAFRIASNKRRNALAAARKWARFRRTQETHIQPRDSATNMDVHAAISHLSPAHRQVLILHYLLDHSVSEIAAELQVPTGTVKSRLLRAREQFTGHYLREDHHVGFS